VVRDSSGHMAGVYAQVDIEPGVHKAPVNDGICAINKIVQYMTKREQEMLNPKGVNLRSVPGRRNRVCGACTATSKCDREHDDPRRHRQWAADLSVRDHAVEAGRVRDLPHLAEDTGEPAKLIHFR
jgi:phage tail sheath protein FI